MVDNLAPGSPGVGVPSSVLATNAGGTAEYWAALSDLLDKVFSTSQGAMLFRSSNAWKALAAGSSGQFLKTLGPGQDPLWASLASGGSFLENGFRLTATTGVAVQTSDTGASTSIFLTPYKSDVLWTYDSSVWTSHSTSGADIALALGTVVSGTNYDIFASWSGGALQLEKIAWSGNTSRATSITRQNGVWVSSADASRRYVGTIRAVSTTQTWDTAAQRFVWNVDNRVQRIGTSSDATATWTVSSNALAPMNSGAGPWLREFVIGLNDMPCWASANVWFSSTSSDNFVVGWGLDSSTSAAPDAQELQSGSTGLCLNWAFNGLLGGTSSLLSGAGYHSLRVLAASTVNGNSVVFQGATSTHTSGVQCAWWC